MPTLPLKPTTPPVETAPDDSHSGSNGVANKTARVRETPPLARKPRRRVPAKAKRMIGSLVALGVLATAVSAYRRMRANAVEHPTVRTAVVSRGTVRATVSATGKLQPFTLVDVKSKAGGTVIKMAVDAGTRVKRGQLICLIDREDTTAAYNQAQADVRAADAAVRSAQESLNYANATIGPQVRQAGESVAAAQARLAQARENLALQGATIGPEIAQSREAVSGAQSRLAQARDALTLQRSTSETAVREARSGVAAARARLEQAQQEARVQPRLSRGAIAQAQSNVESARAGVQSAQETLNLLQTATQPQETASAQAQVAQANSQVRTSQTSLKRLEGLLAKGYVAQNQVDDARNQLVAAQSAAQTAQSRLDTIKEAQAAQVRESQARVAQAQAQLGQAQSGLENARANNVQDSLKLGDVKAAQAAFRQAQNALVSAEANRRQVALKQADVVSAQSALRQSQAALKGTQANSGLANVRQADVSAASSAVRQAQAALAGTQATTIQNRAKVQDIEGLRARLVRAQVTAANARKNLQQTTVVAPRDGIVLKKYVDEGAIIQSGQSGAAGGTSIVQLADTTRIYVDTQVDEADVSLIEAGQKVDVELDAYPNSPKAGTVKTVAPEAIVDQNVTYINVRVEIDQMDVDERLRPGMNGTCEFLVDEKTNVLTAPAEAIKDVDDATQTTVIKNPKAPLWDETNQQTRTVEVGLRGDETVEVTKGLKEGDTVVTQIIQPIAATPGRATGSAPGAAGGGGMRGMGGRGGGGGGGRGG